MTPEWSSPTSLLWLLLSFVFFKVWASGFQWPQPSPLTRKYFYILQPLFAYAVYDLICTAGWLSPFIRSAVFEYAFLCSLLVLAFALMYLPFALVLHYSRRANEQAGSSSAHLSRRRIAFGLGFCLVATPSLYMLAVHTPTEAIPGEKIHDRILIGTKVALNDYHLLSPTIGHRGMMCGKLLKWPVRPSAFRPWSGGRNPFGGRAVQAPSHSGSDGEQSSWVVVKIQKILVTSAHQGCFRTCVDPIWRTYRFSTTDAIVAVAQEPRELTYDRLAVHDFYVLDRHDESIEKSIPFGSFLLVFRHVFIRGVPSEVLWDDLMSLMPEPRPLSFDQYSDEARVKLLQMIETQKPRTCTLEGPDRPLEASKIDFPL